MRSSSSVRPSLWIFAALVLGALAGATYLALDPDAAAAMVGAALGDDDDGPRARQVRVRDPGADRIALRPSGRATGEYQHHDWSQPSELQRTIGLGLPGPGFFGPRRPDLHQRDPQSFAMWRSFANPDDSADPELPFEPTASYATLIDATGDVDASPQSCDVRVLPVTAGQFNCVVRVMCDGNVLYPNPNQTAGYVPCEVENGRPIRAIDDGSTSSDGDPLVDLDLEAGTITVQDFGPDGAERYRATLRINS